MQFRYSGVFVPDVPATVTFYEKAFGCALRYMHPSKGYAELETGATLFAFISEDFIRTANLLGGIRTRENRSELDPIASQIAFVTDDMDKDWSRAVSGGAMVVKEPEAKPWGQTTGYLRDLNGFLVELCTKSPRD